MPHKRTHIIELRILIRLQKIFLSKYTYEKVWNVSFCLIRSGECFNRTPRHHETCLYLTWWTVHSDGSLEHLLGFPSTRNEMNVNDDLKMRVMQILSLTTLNEVTRITDRRNINIGKFTARGILESWQVFQVLVPGSPHFSQHTSQGETKSWWMPACSGRLPAGEDLRRVNTNWKNLNNA